MTWKYDPGSSVSGQIAHKLKLKILMGEYTAGNQLPTVRSLAIEFGVNPNTMQKSMATLEKDGLIVCKSTVGNFVTEDENALENALNTFRKSFIDSTLIHASELGISKEMFSQMLRESEE